MRRLSTWCTCGRMRRMSCPFAVASRFVKPALAGLAAHFLRDRQERRRQRWTRASEGGG